MWTFLHFSRNLISTFVGMDLDHHFSELNHGILSIVFKNVWTKVKLNGSSEILDSLLGFYFQNIKDPFSCKKQVMYHEVVTSKNITYQQVSQEQKSKSVFSSLKSPRVFFWLKLVLFVFFSRSDCSITYNEGGRPDARLRLKT